VAVYLLLWPSIDFSGHVLTFVAVY
jgi:hypothetical protein